MTIDRPEDAARHDTGDALAGGEVGISRAHADQLAADPPGKGTRAAEGRRPAGRRRKQEEAAAPQQFRRRTPNPKAGGHQSARTPVAARPPQR